MPAIAYPRLLQLPSRILGERCTLRPYRSGDGQALFSAIEENREQLGRWLPWVGQHQSVDDAENYVRNMAGRWQTRESLILAIFSHDERTLYGGTGFHGFDWTVPSLEIGWFLRESARGRGIATEAVRLCCTLAFEQMKVNRVWGSVDVLNERSVRLFERVGFLREAHLRGERRDHHGQLRDTLIYGMLARDWESMKAASNAKGDE